MPTLVGIFRQEGQTTPRDKEEEARGIEERGRKGRRLGRARGEDTTHGRMWKEAEETMVTVIIFLSRPVTAQPTR